MADFLTTIPVELVLIALTFWVLRRFDEEERPLLWLSFFAHQLAAIGLIVLNESYYGGGDMLSFRLFGVQAADRLRDDFFGLAPSLVGLVLQRGDPLPIPIRALGSNTGTMQGLSAFAMFFFNDSLYAACAAIAGAAFFSKLALYVAARAELPELGRRATLIACLLVPSAVFWSSGLLKEPFAVIGLFACVYAWHLLLRWRRVAFAVPLLILGGGLIGLLKGYILPVMSVAMAFWFMAKSIAKKRSDLVIRTGHVFVAGALAVLLVAGTGTILPEFAVDNIEDEAARLQIVGARVDGGSNYTLGEASGSETAQLTLLPLGLLTALFRPALFESTNVLIFLNALEMTVFSVLFGMALFRRRITETFAALFRQPFLGFCCVFVLTFGAGVGVATTNLGSLSRYRMPMMPFFALALVTLTARRKAEHEEDAARVAPLPRLPSAPPPSAERWDGTGAAPDGAPVNRGASSA